MVSNTIQFIYNNEICSIKNPDPNKTVLDYIRNDLKKNGTKEGCAEGGCGACTVMVSSYDQWSKTIQHNAVNACLAPLMSMDSMAVTTIEGIGSVKRGLHPIQKRIAELHGSQCGFCTPGFLMIIDELLKSKIKFSENEIREALSGNLCRCTGYENIIKAAKEILAHKGIK